MEFLATMKNQMQEFFSKMSKGQIVRLVVLVLLVVVIAIVAIVMLNRTTYEVLASSDSASELGRINSQLQEMGISTKVTGNSISVPVEVRDTTRWQLAMDGFFDEGGFTTDILQMGQGFSSTESAENSYKTLQRAEDIRKTINGSDKIRSSKILLDIQEPPPYVYSANVQESSASVMLQLRDPEVPLTPQEAAAIRSLLRTSVSGLQDKNITIMDGQYRLYEVGAELNAAQVADGDTIALRADVEARLAKALTDLFEPVFGKGKVAAHVSVQLNFDKTTVQDTTFGPPVPGADTGIPISLERLSENIKGDAGAAQGEPGLDENGGAPSYIEDATAGTDNVYSRTSEKTNMEINETKTLIEKQQGRIENVTASVIIPQDENADDYTEAVRSLAANALGIDTADIAKVTVARMPFIDNATQADAYGDITTQANQYETTRLLIIVGAIVLVIILLLLALRTVLKALRPEPEPVLAMAGGGVYAEERYDEEGNLIEDYDEDDEATQALNELVEDLRQEDQPLAQVQKFVEKDPESVAQLLRNWLSDDFR